MITDRIPRKLILKQEYFRSEELRIIDLPPAQPLREMAGQLEIALSCEDRSEVQANSNELAKSLADFYEIKAPTVKVLGVRPTEESNGFVDETFGDYSFATARIRLWMRTAVLEKATSFGTLLSTLCHEICHHLDVVYLGLPNTFHTRGFYERAGLLYHHVRGTEVRILVWDKQSDGTFRINWPMTMRGASNRATKPNLSLGNQRRS